MKILVEYRHPAHYHHFKHTVIALRKRGHDVKVVISVKDILEQLLKESNESYTVIGKNRKGIINKIKEIIKQDINLFRILKNYKPALVVGRPSHPLAFTSFLLRIPAVIFGEDDVNAIFFNAIIGYPFTQFVLAPDATDLSIFRKKKIAYHGYQKLAYLHKNYFAPDFNLIKTYVDTSRPFYIIRLAKFTAGHDIKISGIDNDVIKRLISKLERHGQIYITCERELDKNLEKYRINIPPQYMHHLLYFCDFFIGDSQSMAFECAMLGTPSIRFNDFVGRLNVLEELEHKYGLTFGIKTSSPEKLIAKIEELILMPNLKEEFQKRRHIMLGDKIDVTGFMIWFIENYPESKRIMKENPDYQFKFK